jgi:cytochrome c556
MCKRFLGGLFLRAATGRLRPRLRLPAVAVLIVIAGSTVAAQQNYPAFSEADLDRSMKTAGFAFELVKRALAKNDIENAKDYLSRLREQLATSITFWRQRQRDDAVKMLRAALTHIDDGLDPILAAESVDSSTVNRRVQEIDAACAACHAVYREQDPVTKAYRLKTGSVR